METIFERACTEGAKLTVEVTGAGAQLTISDATGETKLPLTGYFALSLRRVPQEPGLGVVRVLGTNNVDYLLSREDLANMRAAVRARAEKVARRAEDKKLKSAARDAEVRRFLMDFVGAVPGRGLSHYSRERCPGLEVASMAQDRKENMMRELIKEGKLELVKLPRPQGRRTHAVYLPGRVPVDLLGN